MSWWIVPLVAWATLGVIGDNFLAAQRRLIAVAIARARGNKDKPPITFSAPIRFAFGVVAFLVLKPISAIFLIYPQVIGTRRMFLYQSVCVALSKLNALDASRGFHWDLPRAMETALVWYCWGAD